MMENIPDKAKHQFIDEKKDYTKMNDNELCEELRKEKNNLFTQLNSMSEALARLLKRTPMRF